MSKQPWVSYLLPFLAMIGFLLSGYAYYVEHRFAKSKELGLSYRAYCDVGVFSCTKVFSSEYGSITQKVGLPKVSNAAVGMVFYLFELAICRFPLLVLTMGIASALASVGLFFILTVILHDLCMVCCSIYVVNFLTCFCAWRWYKYSASAKVSKARRRQK